MRAVIITGRYVQDHEFIYPYYRLQEAGFEVDVATPNKETVEGFIGVKVVPTKAITELSTGDYDLLVLPGGVKAMESLRQNKDVLDFIKRFYYHTDKTIASICSGAQLLISAYIVKGKRISGYYSIKDDIENAGAIFVDAPVVVDDNIITSPHYKYLGDWMKTVIEHTNSKSQ